MKKFNKRDYEEFARTANISTDLKPLNKSKGFLLYPDMVRFLVHLSPVEMGYVSFAIFFKTYGLEFDQNLLSEKGSVTYEMMAMQIERDAEKYEEQKQKNRERQRRFYSKTKGKNLTHSDVLPIKDVDDAVEVEVEDEVDVDEDGSSLAAANNKHEGSDESDPDSAAWQQNFIKVFNKCVEGSNIPPILSLSGERLEKLKQLRELMQKTPGIPKCHEVFQKAARSPFLNGQGVKNKFQATFDWLIEPEHYFKVMEGNYS